MFFDRRVRRFAGATSLGLAVLGAAVAATHPAATAAALVIAENTVTCGTSAACFIAKNTSSGPGVLATSATGIALQGTGGRYGVQGKSTNNYGVFGTSSAAAGVAGTTPNGYGVYGYTTGSGSNVGVYGVSPAGYGVSGTTTTGNGIGVIGTSAGSGVGMYGSSASGYGTEGITGSGYGLYANAYAGGTGIFSTTSTGYGLVSYTGGSVPVYARNSNGNGGDFAGTYIGLIARSPSGGYPLVLTDSNSNDLFFVDGAGNVSYHGGLFNFAKVGGGATVKSFNAKMTAPTVEDTGTAQLVGGAAVIRLDPTFAASIDATSGYRVFLTPGGDTRGLFVTGKSAGGFIVRESQGGHATVSFDYRIVATSLGQAGERMAVTGPGGSSAAPRALQPIVPHLAAQNPLTPQPALAP